MVDTLECEGENKYMVMICSLISLLAALVSVMMVLCSSPSLDMIPVRILIFSVSILKYFLVFSGISRLELDSPGSGPGDGGHIGVRGGGSVHGEVMVLVLHGWFAPSTSLVVLV